MEVGSGSKRSKEKKEKKEGKKEEKKAKKEEKKKKKRRRREQSSPSSSPPSSAPSSPPSPSSRLVDSYLQIMKYSMKQGRASRLDRILKTLPKDEVKTLLRMHDSSGKTPLHQASRIGNIEVVTVLLRNGANAGVQDSEGNSPAHLAASNGHLLSLTQLLQSKDPPDIDSQNHAGQSLSQLVSQLMNGAGTGGTASGTASVAGASLPGSSGVLGLLPGGLHSGGLNPMLGAGGQKHWWSEDEEEVDEEEVWRRKLRGHDSDADDGWGDDESSWGHGAFSNSMRADERARSAAQAAEASRVVSQRILNEERAKDEEWRRRATIPALMVEVMLPPINPSIQRHEYESKWIQLEATAAAATSNSSQARAVSWAVIPWPLPDAYLHQTELLRDVLLHGVTGPADIKKRLRREIMRWHPDKFVGRYGAILLPSDKDRILQKVHEVSQVVTAGIMSSGK
eukprot:gene29662-5080_t